MITFVLNVVTDCKQKEKHFGRQTHYLEPNPPARGVQASGPWSPGLRPMESRPPALGAQASGPPTGPAQTMAGAAGPTVELGSSAAGTAAGAAALWAQGMCRFCSYRTSVCAQPTRKQCSFRLPHWGPSSTGRWPQPDPHPSPSLAALPPFLSEPHWSLEPSLSPGPGRAQRGDESFCAGCRLAIQPMNVALDVILG